METAAKLIIYPWFDPQFTVTGLHGAYLEYVAELVEEVLNTEADFATILLLQAVETHVRGHLVNQLPATRGHVQVKKHSQLILKDGWFQTLYNSSMELENLLRKLVPPILENTIRRSQTFILNF